MLRNIFTKTLRDQRIAHNDAMPEDATILMGQMDQFLETTVTIFNDLSGMHSRSTTHFDYQTKRSEWEAGEILKILQQDADQGALEIEAAMRKIREEPRGGG